VYGWDWPRCTVIMGEPARTQQIDWVVMIPGRFSAIMDVKGIRGVAICQDRVNGILMQSHESRSSRTFSTGCSAYYDIMVPRLGPSYQRVSIPQDYGGDTAYQRTMAV
jgi:hypothetical protein